MIRDESPEQIIDNQRKPYMVVDSSSWIDRYILCLLPITTPLL